MSLFNNIDVKLEATWVEHGCKEKKMTIYGNGHEMTDLKSRLLKVTDTAWAIISLTKMPHQHLLSQGKVILNYWPIHCVHSKREGFQLVDISCSLFSSRYYVFVFLVLLAALPGHTIVHKTYRCDALFPSPCLHLELANKRNKWPSTLWANP